jgi:hypothetical protein
MGPSTSLKSYNEPQRLHIDDLQRAGDDDMDAEVASRSAVTPLVAGQQHITKKSVTDNDSNFTTQKRFSFQQQVSQDMQ